MKKTDDAVWNDEKVFDQQLGYLRSRLDNRAYMLVRRVSAGLAGWISQQWQAEAVAKPTLTVVAKVQLGPRHFVSLIEADGMHFLVANANESAATIQALPIAVQGFDEKRGNCSCCGQLSRHGGHKPGAHNGAVAESDRTGMRGRAGLGRISW